MKLNENILRGQELLELGKKLIYGNEEDNALAVIAGTVIVQKAAEYLRAEYINRNITTRTAHRIARTTTREKN